MVLRICFEANLVVAVGTLEIEAEDFNAQVSLLVADLHPHVELGTYIEVVGADIASQGHGQHVAHVH